MAYEFLERDESGGNGNFTHESYLLLCLQGMIAHTGPENDDGEPMLSDARDLARNLVAGDIAAAKREAVATAELMMRLNFVRLRTNEDDWNGQE